MTSRGYKDLDAAKAMIRAGVKFGVVYRSLSTRDQRELKDWFVNENSVPKIHPRPSPTQEIVTVREIGTVKY